MFNMSWEKMESLNLSIIQDINMGSIILAILIVFLFYRLYRWTEKNTYSDPPNGTVYKYPENGKTAINEYLDQIEKEDDSRLAKSIWGLLDDCDIAVAYNGVSFDFKRCNTRFLKHDLTPPSYYVPVDPIITAKKCFDIS